ncbi:uncharacterized protein B0H18DRAFT_86798 [Fomitopsis serialis]|uniref:uncharacterized protein n=1 Tax=Fomitopsis serialis TaxID=139415 RepID=UPI00200731A7|nr:uncharacterized protein B0H18DRAFT_86798 [Neoantrodia serialis]KAH9931527.1 hypothetical protein B0H18DRAFT_86798 [Neoantrodia serialis]
MQFQALSSSKPRSVGQEASISPHSTTDIGPQPTSGSAPSQPQADAHPGRARSDRIDTSLRTARATRNILETRTQDWDHCACRRTERASGTLCGPVQRPAKMGDGYQLHGRRDCMESTGRAARDRLCLVTFRRCVPKQSCRLLPLNRAGDATRSAYSRRNTGHWAVCGLSCNVPADATPASLRIARRNPSRYSTGKGDLG